MKFLNSSGVTPKIKSQMLSHPVRALLKLSTTRSQSAIGAARQRFASASKWFSAGLW